MVIKPLLNGKPVIPASGQHGLLFDTTRGVIDAAEVPASASAPVPGSEGGALVGYTFVGWIKLVGAGGTLYLEVRTDPDGTTAAAFEVAKTIALTAGTAQDFEWRHGYGDCRARFVPSGTVSDVEGEARAVSGAA